MIGLMNDAETETETETVRLRPAGLCAEAQAILDAIPAHLEGLRRDGQYYAYQARYGMRDFVEGMIEHNRGWAGAVALTDGEAAGRAYENRALLAEAELRARDEAAAAGLYVGR